MTKTNLISESQTPTKSHFSTLHMAALWYAFSGFTIMPIVPDSTKPLLIEGVPQTSSETDLINRWWKQTPNANVAIVTSDLLVLEISNYAQNRGWESLKWLEETYGKLPQTCMQITPDGSVQYVFRAPGINLPCEAYTPLLNGIRVSTSSGFMLVDPSIVNGRRYVMLENNIANAPGWLVSTIVKMMPKCSSPRRPIITWIKKPSSRNS